MALLKLSDIGKIYVSEGNVAVGIRGVSLSFERGEFVAVTGKSGSGKSTLLNVISGMDSYEEGELYIEGQATSHYLQPEWEEYREKYISFIFQDYNIIDSFTVLQNVELALMHIEDKKERRRRALELIEKVGLSSHIKHKGSKLSGGQKQRTVIARALAKDSPIILADEPTGNLDSQTSKEIIELLREVSKNKLLIVVTHNFDQVEDYATRHIRIFDGAVEFDHEIREKEVCRAYEEIPRENNKRADTRRLIKNGITLGRTIFTAKPKLSAFLCLLMMIGSLAIFIATSISQSSLSVFDESYMFSHIEGRVIMTRRNGEVIKTDELKKIAEDYEAVDYLRFDSLLDTSNYNYVTVPVGDDVYDYTMIDDLKFTYNENFGKDIVGRYPEKDNEILLRVPISYQNILGKDNIIVNEVGFQGTTYKLVGIKYYYDNNQQPSCLLTEKGFRTATAMNYLRSASLSVSVTIFDENGEYVSDLWLHDVAASYDVEDGKIYVDSEEYRKLTAASAYATSVNLLATYYKYDYNYSSSSQAISFEKNFVSSDITKEKPYHPEYSSYYSSDKLILSDELVCEIAEAVLEDSYCQVSLFFENDRLAAEAAKKLSDKGFIAVTSNTTYEPDPFTVILETIAALFLGFFWILNIVFVAFFINLTSSRVLMAFRSDMAIMRSMGIQVKVIKIGMYVRMLISLIPAFLSVILLAILLFTSPLFNAMFSFLYIWEYFVIFFGMILLSVRITKKQISKLFGESVKKSLKGGSH